MWTKYVRFEKPANGGAANWTANDFKIIVQMIRRPCQCPMRTSWSRLCLAVKPNGFQLHFLGKEWRTAAPSYIGENIIFNAGNPSLNSAYISINKPGNAWGGYSRLVKQHNISSFQIPRGDRCGRILT